MHKPRFYLFFLICVNADRFYSAVVCRENIYIFDGLKLQLCIDLLAPDSEVGAKIS